MIPLTHGIVPVQQTPPSFLFGITATTVNVGDTFSLVMYGIEGDVFEIVLGDGVPNVYILPANGILSTTLSTVVDASITVTTTETAAINRFAFSNNNRVIKTVNVTNAGSLTSLKAVCQFQDFLESFVIDDTSNVTDLSDAFKGTLIAQSPPMDTSNVTDVSNMLSSCIFLTDLYEYDLSSVIFMGSYINSCTSLTSTPAFNTPLATDFVGAVSGCTSLICMTSIDTTNQTDTTDLFLFSNSLVAPNASEQAQIEAGFSYVNPSPCP